MAEKEKRNRAANFSNQEKLYLISLVSSNKNVLENKKTDAVTNNEKDRIWDKITAEFNALSPDANMRSKECLKRLYENKKKELKKKAAQEQFELKKTGGGTPLVNIKDPCDELLLSLISKKTVYGLPSEFGGDAVDIGEDEVQNTNTEAEIIFEFDPENTQTVEIQNNNPEVLDKTWKKYKSTDLSEPISTPLRTSNTDMQTKPLVIREEIQGTNHSVETLETPKRKSLCASRRRPAVTVKALTSSEVASKYNMLLDARLEMADFMKKKQEQEQIYMLQKHEKETALLDIQIEVEKEKLKRLKRNDL